MADAGIIRDIPDFDKPLCPNIGFPDNAAHRLYIRCQNVVYEASEPLDENDDFTLPEVAKINRALTYEKMSDRMDLYFIRSLIPRTNNVIETYYFKCHICGLILPAYKK